MQTNSSNSFGYRRTKHQYCLPLLRAIIANSTLLGITLVILQNGAVSVRFAVKRFLLHQIWNFILAHIPERGPFHVLFVVRSSARRAI